MNLYKNVSKHKHETFNDENIKIGIECGALEYDKKSDSIRFKKEMSTSVIYSSKEIHDSKLENEAYEYAINVFNPVNTSVTLPTEEIQTRYAIAFKDGIKFSLKKLNISLKDFEKLM